LAALKPAKLPSLVIRGDILCQLATRQRFDGNLAISGISSASFIATQAGTGGDEK